MLELRQSAFVNSKIILPKRLTLPSNNFSQSCAELAWWLLILANHKAIYAPKAN